MPGFVFVSYVENPDAVRSLGGDAEKRRLHRDNVRLFAEFLLGNGIDVVYDQNVQGTSQEPENWVRWTAEKVQASQFVLMVCTSNYVKYLNSEHPDEVNSYGCFRPLFEEGKIVSNLMMQNLRKFIPVFLHCKRRTEFVPIALQGSSFYEIQSPFELNMERHGPLEMLYARLSGQNPYKPPPPGDVKKLKMPSIGAVRSFGGGRLFGGSGGVAAPPFRGALSSSPAGQKPQPPANHWEKRGEDQVEEDLIASIGDHIGQWVDLARKLGFSEGMISNVKYDFRHDGQKEQGIQMLVQWSKNEREKPTVKKLVVALQKANRMDVIDKIEDYFVRIH
eukprot:m.308833 g.308833  ORF g.308833 m.308833 type:complete len:334 (+) comp44941_c0_seq1:737-1738(+)